MEIILSLLLIIAVPAILIYVLALLEPFAVTRLRVIIFSLTWGLTSYLVADVIQGNQLNALKESGLSLAVSLHTAPILEEFLKIAFLMVIYHYTLARYAGDGLVYGFAVGSGFAIAENLVYVLGQPDQALGTALTRIVSSGLFHASLIGLLGTAVCGVIYYRRWFTYPFFAVLFLFAVLAHHFFNILALLEYFLSDVSGLIQIGIFLFAITIGVQLFIRFREKRRITHDVSDALNPMEMMAVRDGGAVTADLEKQAAQLGEEQVDLIRDYLISESQIALLTHQTIKGRGKRHNIQNLRADLSALREKTRKLKQKLSPEALNWLDQERKRLANR